MTSEAHHLNSPPPAVSVKVRAKEIEARTQAAGRGLSFASGPPVASQEVTGKRYQVPNITESQKSTFPGGDPSSYPSRRCSEGDIFQQNRTKKVPPPLTPRQRRVSLENSPLPIVPERRSTLGRLLENSEGSSSGGLATATLCQTETTSKLAPFTGGGKSGVTCHKQPTSDFSPAIFSTSRLFPASEAPSKQSPLDDIITALEKIRDEFELPDSVNEGPAGQRDPSADQKVDQSLRRGSDDVFEKHAQTTQGNDYKRRGSRDVSDKTQWQSEHGLPQVDPCQEIGSDLTRKSFESILTSTSLQSAKQPPDSEESYYDTEPIIYRSTVQFSPKSQERHHVVSATLQVSPPRIPSHRESEYQNNWCSSAHATVSEAHRPSIERSLRFNNTVVVLETSDGKNAGKVDQKSLLPESLPPRKSSLKEEYSERNTDHSDPYVISQSKSHSYQSDKRSDSRECGLSLNEKTQDVLSKTHKETKDLNVDYRSDYNTKTPALFTKPEVPKILTLSSSLSSEKDYQNEGQDSNEDERKRDVSSPSEELEIVKNILANLDFERYRRRHSLDDMEEKSPKPQRVQKSSSVKLKDFFDLLKPNSDGSSGSSKKPFGLCRSSSFTNAETITSDISPTSFFLQNEENDAVSPLPEDTKKISTLPRRKSPSRQSFTKVSAQQPFPAVASCPSIVKLEPQKVLSIKDPVETDFAYDEGLVSDSEVGPGAYVTAYVSCVSSSSTSASSSGRRGHVRSASDNVTSVSSTPEVQIKKTLSTEKLWTSIASRLNGTEKRKRRKGMCSDGNPMQESVKTGAGRSLTYPPQRKSSTSEEEQEYTSVDSNGLTSLKHLTAGLVDSRTDGVRLLSDLSLADSHLCPSEGTVDETYLDVVDSVMHSPNDAQHLSVEDRSSSSGKPHKKKHHSDPGGEACSSGPGDGFMADSIGSSRSESDLGGNELITPSSSSCSSASSETSTRATQTYDDRHHLKLVIDGKKGQGSKHIRTNSSGSLTSGATPHSRFQFPDTDASNQRLAIEPSLSSKSPQEQRRYSKRRLRGPYGEMLEEEMRKSGEKQKPAYNDLSFLQDLCESKGKSLEKAPRTENASSQTQTPRPAMFLSSQSLDDASSTSSKSDLAMCVTPKRKISANYPLFTDGETVAIASDEDITPTKPQPCTESIVDDVVSTNGENISENKNTCVQKTKDETPKRSKGLSETFNFNDPHSDTRTHVVGELYDTEKSYVESLQLLTNKYMKPLKSPEYSGIVETGLVDEIFYQIPEILSHHEGFLELLKQRIANWDSKQKVGDVFVEAFTKKNVSETYTAFINNWKSAKDAIKLATQAKPAFARFLEHMSREHKGKLTLDALLIMPVQRIPRYELLIKELLKHTHIDHPDHHPLVEAQKEVHDLALKINRMEREAFQLEQMQQRVREIEQLIDGVIDLAQPDRDFIRHDVVSMPGGLGAKKERCLFLFSDVLLITSMKRKSTTMRKPSSTSSLAQNALSCLEMNKYKLLTKFSLDNLDIAKSTDSGFKKLLKDIENLEQDVALLNQISELVSKLTSHNQALEDVVKETMNGMSKQLNEKQNVDAHLVSLELNVTTQESIDSLTIQFPTPEKRSVWEAAFNDAKQKLALSTDRRPPPEFMHPLPIRKTRAGLQFTCATATLGLNQQGLRDVWVCNSDGYVGQVCVLSLMPEPTVMSCNGVCNARILTIASIPAACSIFAEKSRWKPNLPDNISGVSVEVIEVDEECEEERTNNGNIELDSDTSDEDDDTESTDDEKGREERKRGNSIPKDDCQEDMDNKQPTMWLGTEDGCIHVYNCNDNIRTKKNKIKIQLSAAILCIIYLDNKVFVSVANGEIHVYKKDPNGGWCTCESQKVNIGSSAAPVTRMLAVAGKLWCGCQNMIYILNTGTLQVEHSFTVSSDNTRTVLCMATSGLGVWISLHHSAILRLFHATSYECLFDLNVAPAVTKMLAGCDDIIRQHKAACLRVTALLACKDLLWVGTSAGVILTLPLPHLTSTTNCLDNISNVSGLPYGHTGHVRFLTCVEMTPGTSLDLAGYNKYALRSLRSKEGTSGRRASTSASAVSRLMVISGGDGYEDFQNSGLGEAAGRDDSTNHLLLWQV